MSDSSSSSTLVARWNATYPPGTPCTVNLTTEHGKFGFSGGSLECVTTDIAMLDSDIFPEGAEVVLPVVSLVKGRESEPFIVPLCLVEHRIVLDGALEQSLRGLGMPPLSELDDPGSPVNLRDIPRERWLEHDHEWLVIPDAIAGYIARLAAPLTEVQVIHIERHIAEFHGLEPCIFAEGEPWLRDSPSTPAEWIVTFSFAFRFITGTAQLQRNPRFK